MSAMEDMLGKMLAKALPPEVMALLTPEKIKELGEGINAYITDTRERLTNLETQNEKIIASLKVLLERSDNEHRKPSGSGDGSNDSSERTRKRGGSNGANAS